MTEPSIPAKQANDVFLADIEEAEHDRDSLHLWWLGQSGFLCSWNRVRVVLDPYLSDSLTRKYAGTDKPHVRMSERVVAPDRLRGIHLVTSSHMHTDHCDPETLAPLLASNPGARLICPEVNRRAVADRIGWEFDDPRLHGLADGTRFVSGPVRIEGIPAAHEELLPEYLGYVVSLGPWRIHHSGDTIPYAGMAARLRSEGIHVSLLPINGRRPERRVAGNLFGDEAAALAKEIGAAVAIPCHYDMFAFNTETPARFTAECKRLQQHFRLLSGGDRFTLQPT